MQKKFLLIGLPNWIVGYPFYSLAVIDGIIKSCGWEC